MHKAIYEADNANGQEEPSIAETSQKAIDQFKVFCNKGTNAENLEERRQNLINAMATLNAVEEKHASRSLFWRIIHYFGESKPERDAISQMKKDIESAKKDNAELFKEAGLKEITEEDYKGESGWMQADLAEDTADIEQPQQEQVQQREPIDSVKETEDTLQKETSERVEDKVADKIIEPKQNI